MNIDKLSGRDLVGRELAAAIRDNQQLSDYGDSFVRCDMCGAAILSGKYYCIDGICICEDCLEICEYRV